MSSKLISETKRYTEQAQDGIITHDIQNLNPNIGAAQTTGAFPRGGLGAGDSRDEFMKEKYEQIEAGGSTGMTPFGLVTATDADWAWLKRKRESEAFANLDAWIGQNFHVQDVATRKWLQETYPEYYEARERLMVDRAKFALRIKLLKLRGPKNHKDLVLQWGLQTGRIKLDRNWDVIGAYAEPGKMNMSVERGRFQKGLFNVFRYLSNKERENNQLENGPNGQAGFNANPFKPRTPGQADGQNPSQFPGVVGLVGNGTGAQGRYPEFLREVIQKNW